LWSIAIAYGTTIEEIKALNRLSTNDIFVGQKLVVRKDAPGTPTIPPLTATSTIGLATSTAAESNTATVTLTSTPLPAQAAAAQTGGWVALSIVLGALLMAGALTWRSIRKPI
jgi:hypothetical protein